MLKKNNKIIKVPSEIKDGMFYLDLWDDLTVYEIAEEIRQKKDREKFTRIILLLCEIKKRQMLEEFNDYLSNLF